jgi:hypothetical protein
MNNSNLTTRDKDRVQLVIGLTLIVGSIATALGLYLVG